MSLCQQLYDNSPVWLQNIAICLVGYKKNRMRYGQEYWTAREQQKAFDHLTLEEKLLYQQEQLQAFIRYAAKNSPFYRELYAGIDIAAIKTIEDLKKLPIIDKEMLRKNLMRVFTITDELYEEWHTGGTTGKSLMVKALSSDEKIRHAIWDHCKSKLGVENLKTRRATFNGKHIVPPGSQSKVFWRYNYPARQKIFSSFHITEANIPHYLEELNRYKPEVIDGFFTSMCDIANYIIRHDVDLSFQPIAIFPTSETLTQSGREQLEKAFKCKVYNFYSSSEGAPYITECNCGQLHVELNTGVFEILENNEILVTSFQTHGTPLIRYRIGDVIIPSREQQCPCGNPSPIIAEIQGRRLDFLYTSEGAKINGGNISNLFKNVPNAIIRAQLIQNTMNEVDIFLQVDPLLYCVEYDNLIQREFRHKFGDNTKANIRHVDSIPRADNGKFRMIINNVKSSEDKSL